MIYDLKRYVDLVIVWSLVLCCYHCYEEEEKEEDCDDRKPQTEMLTLASLMVSGLGWERCTGSAPIRKGF